MSSQDVPSADWSDALERLRDARERQFDRTRWFGRCLIVVGIVLIPSGFSLPWDLPARLAVIAVTFAALIAVSSYIGRHRVVPRSSIPYVATVCWFGLSVVMELIWNDVDLAGGLVAAAVASIPFFVAGWYFLMRRAGTEKTDASRPA